MTKIIAKEKIEAKHKSNPRKKITSRKILKLIKIKRRKYNHKNKEKCLANINNKENSGKPSYSLNFSKYNFKNMQLMNFINDKINAKNIFNNNKYSIYSNLEKNNTKMKKDESCQTDLNDLFNLNNYTNPNNNNKQQNRNSDELNSNSNFGEYLIGKKFEPLDISCFKSNSLINQQHHFINNSLFGLQPYKMNQNNNNYFNNNCLIDFIPFTNLQLSPIISFNYENNNYYNKDNHISDNNSNNNYNNNNITSNYNNTNANNLNINNYTEINNRERRNNNNYASNNLIFNNNPDNTKINSIKDNLSKLKIKKQYLINKDNQKNCLICLEDFKYAQTIYKLSCSHIFHVHCFNKEVKIRQKCPICRRNI